jgi:hypothetical protein
MLDGDLDRRLREAGLGGDRLQADRDRVAPQPRRLAQQVQLYDESGRLAVMTYQVGHQGIDHVRFECKALHSDNHYTDYRYPGRVPAP